MKNGRTGSLSVPLSLSLSLSLIFVALVLLIEDHRSRFTFNFCTNAFAYFKFASTGVATLVSGGDEPSPTVLPPIRKRHKQRPRIPIDANDLSWTMSIHTRRILDLGWKVLLVLLSYGDHQEWKAMGFVGTGESCSHSSCCSDARRPSHPHVKQQKRNWIAHGRSRSHPTFSFSTMLSILSSYSVGSVSWVGSDPNRPQKVNQDAYFHTTIEVSDSKNFSSNQVFGVAGVLDGHGKKAERLTEFLSIHLPKCVAQQLNDPKPVRDLEEQIEILAKYQLHTRDKNMTESCRMEQVLCNAFHQAHWDAMLNTSVPAGRCGTTCIVCLWNEKTLYVGHVGDSRAYRFLGSSQDPPEPLTTPTTIQEGSDEERVRIEKGEGRIDDSGNVWYGPIGIAMTRALGDSVLLRAGVIPTPLVHTFPRQQKKEPHSNENTRERIVLATDGIWDVLPALKVQEMLANIDDSLSTQEVANLLAESAKSAWVEQSPFIDEVKSDDITCVVLDL